MTLTATYASDLSRVRLVLASVPSGADTAKVERSTDQVTWSVVRGGDALVLSSGAAHLDDYEFVPNVVNYYRTTNVDTGTITFVNQGTHATGNNAPVTPGLPASLVAGDLMVLFAGIQNSGAGSPPATIAGWNTELVYGPMAFYTRRYVSGDTAPTVTFTGGVSGASTSAFIVGWRNAQPGYDVINGNIGTSNQNITTPTGLAVPGNNREIVAFSWKQNGAATAGSTLTGFGATVTLANALGSGQSLFYSRISAASNVHTVTGPQTLTVTGGAAAISRSLFFAFRQADYVTQDTASLTPTLDDGSGVQKLWIKNIQRPYMNTAVNSPLGKLVITQKARAGIFPVVRRSKPVAVTDLRGSQEYTIGALVLTDAERDRLKLILAVGEPIFLHVPPGIRLSSMYASVGDTSYDDEAGTYSLPLTEVAAPASTIVGATILYSDILATYATYAAVLAAYATYADILESIGDPTDVITG